MEVKIKRVYEPPSDEDGFRILVDRLWPRGLSKKKAKIDLWLKDIAPSDELRKWFNHDPTKWEEFKMRYFEELNKNPKLRPVIELLKKGVNVTLLYAAKSPYNNAVALKEYIENLLKKE